MCVINSFKPWVMNICVWLCVSSWWSTGAFSWVWMSQCHRPIDDSPLWSSLLQASDSHSKTDTVLEVGELEGDTLDPQTGLFYRSTQPAADTAKQTSHSAGAQPPPLGQAEAEQSRHSSTSSSSSTPTPTPAPAAPPPPPPQLQSKPQISQPSPSSSTAFPSTPPLTKKLPKLREQSQPKPQTLTQSPKDRPVTAPAQAGAKVTTPGTPTKHLVTPQLPKLQQAPTSHHRPLHTPMSHPPPLQAHHPVSTEKTTPSQVSGATQTLNLMVNKNTEDHSSEFCFP